MWILILVLNAYSGDGGVAVHHVEFSSQRACEMARAAIMGEVERTRRSVRVTAVCTAK